MHPDLFIVLVNQRVEEDRREAAAERLLIRRCLKARLLPHRRDASTGRRIPRRPAIVQT